MINPMINLIGCGMQVKDQKYYGNGYKVDLKKKGYEVICKYTKEGSKRIPEPLTNIDLVADMIQATKINIKALGKTGDIIILERFSVPPNEIIFIDIRTKIKITWVKVSISKDENPKSLFSYLKDKDFYVYCGTQNVLYVLKEVLDENGKILDIRANKTINFCHSKFPEHVYRFPYKKNKQKNIFEYGGN